MKPETIQRLVQQVARMVGTRKQCRVLEKETCIECVDKTYTSRAFGKKKIFMPKQETSFRIRKRTSC